MERCEPDGSHENLDTHMGVSLEMRARHPAREGSRRDMQGEGREEVAAGRPACLGGTRSGGGEGKAGQAQRRGSP